MTIDQANKAAVNILAAISESDRRLYPSELASIILSSCQEEKEFFSIDSGDSFSGFLGDEIMEIVNKWFNRRYSTRWSDKEFRSLHKVVCLKTSKEDFEALEKYYLSNCAYKRKDIYTLLNNWNGEIDRAKAWKPVKTSDDRQGRDEQIKPKRLI